LLYHLPAIRGAGGLPTSLWKCQKGLEEFHVHLLLSLLTCSLLETLGKLNFCVMIDVLLCDLPRASKIDNAMIVWMCENVLQVSDSVASVQVVLECPLEKFIL